MKARATRAQNVQPTSSSARNRAKNFSLTVDETVLAAEWLK
jgi:hypothetical protein